MDRAQGCEHIKVQWGASHTKGDLQGRFRCIMERLFTSIVANPFAVGIDEGCDAVAIASCMFLKKRVAPRGPDNRVNYPHTIVESQLGLLESARQQNHIMCVVVLQVIGSILLKEPQVPLVRQWVRHRKSTRSEKCSLDVKMLANKEWCTLRRNFGTDGELSRSHVTNPNIQPNAQHVKIKKHVQAVAL